ncbi:MAG: S8 family serine peptidase [Planctomycetes bacterium]|nr:S8 family serine peptidase [Planctomycetota bacterium]
MVAIERLGGRVADNYWIVSGASIEIPFDRIDEVRALEGVLRLTPDRALVPTIKTITNGANHNSDAVNALGFKGKGATIAFMDTGFDSNSGSKGRPHQIFYEEGDLTKRLRLLANVQIGLQPADNSDPHGTAIVGAAAGGKWSNANADNGHAPQADIVGYCIAEFSNGNTTNSRLILGFQTVLADATKYGIQIAHVGYQGFPDPLDMTQQASDQCSLVGNILVVCGAGNATSTTRSPSCANGIAVGAVTPTSHTVTSFSGVGPITGDALRYYPDMAACSHGIIAPKIDDETGIYGYPSGTSVASASVSGAAALLLGAVPSLTAEETKAILLATARDISSKNATRDRNSYGMGLLGCDTALTLAQNASGWGRGSVDSTNTMWQRSFSVQAGKTYRTAATWMRQIMTSTAWSNLDVEVLQGSTVIASSKTPRNLYEVITFQAPATGTVLVRVSGVTIENNKQDFGWAFTEAAAPPLRSEYATYGAGCAGASQGCSLLQSYNWSQSLAAQSTSATEIGILEFGHPTINVCGVDFYMSAKSSPQTVTVRLRDSNGVGGVPGSVLGSATVNVGTSAGVYSVRFSPLIRIFANSLFYVTIDNADKLNLPVAPSGKDLLHYEYQNGSWVFGNAVKWQYRLHSDNGQLVPSLSSNDTPVLGKSMSVDLASARANVPAIFLLGFSDTMWGPIPLPFAYAGTCKLLASGDVMLGAATSATGTASISLVVPASPALVGLRFYNQFLVVEPVNAFGLVASNAGKGLIGDF